MRWYAVSVLVVLLSASFGARAENAPLTSGLKPFKTFAVEPTFKDDDDNTAQDLSGLACLPSSDGERHCLAINDEDQAAQTVTLRDGVLVPGPRFRLIRKRDQDTYIGAAPQLHCSGGGPSFKDLDGEAVAYAEVDGQRYFIVAGSHGCSRKKAKARISSFLTVRLAVDRAGALLGVPEATYRLSEVLAAIPFGNGFGKDLMGEDASQRGLNVEGIAVVGDVLYVGLRAPSVDGKAGIVSVPVRALFTKEASLGAASVIRVPLGADRGIRDLAPMADGRLLLLTGPAQDQDLPYGVVLIDPKKPESPTNLATLDELRVGDVRGKAEGVLLLGEDANTLDILVVFDGLSNGAPREYRVALH